GKNLTEDQSNNESVVGRIGGKDIILNIINPRLFEPKSYYPSCLYEKKGFNIMRKITNDEIVGINTPLNEILEIFRKTKFAFIPIVESIKGDDKNDNVFFHKVKAVLTVRDFLRLFIDTKIKMTAKSITEDDWSNMEKIKNTPVNRISSDLISVRDDEFLKDAISLMINNGVRNLGILDNNSKFSGIINDRDIVEFLLNPELRVIAGCNQDSTNTGESNINNDSKILDEIKIKNNVKISSIRQINENMLIKEAAELLLDSTNPYLVLKGGDRIVTPWDIVMKEYYLKGKK
ncbi:MAG: CBS domain-containing protein, partial [Nitrososphaeraceae archaeon]|nr:CBS domain-containing protein [Nitrososphaeraceae archaeon]